MATNPEYAKTRHLRSKRLILFSVLLAPTVVASTAVPAARAQEVSLNAFGDINYGYRCGDPASERAAERFETYGEDIHPKSSHSGFGLAGTDFVLTAELPADIVYLGEVNLQVERGQQSAFEFDVERMFLEKRIIPAFNVQAGLFFTPIGYFNRTLYSRAFLMNSVQVPDLFEEELGLVPTHTVGLLIHGQFGFPNLHRLQYLVSLGNGRGADPVANVYARDDDGWRSITAMAEWWFPWANELRVGVSGWFDKVETYRLQRLGEVADIKDPSTETLKLVEVGLDAHVVLKSQYVNLVLEGVYQLHHGTGDTLPTDERDTHLWGLLAELALNVGPEGAIKPYVRYDLVELPDNAGPYLGLRRDGDEFARVYVANSQMGMLGVAWDAAISLRLKLEYSLAFTGPREVHSIIGQGAFAF